MPSLGRLIVLEIAPLIKGCVAADQKEINMVDMSQLTVEDLLEEMNKRVQNSADTGLKRQLAMIVERRALPAKRRGFTQKAKINGQALLLRKHKSHCC